MTDQPLDFEDILARTWQPHWPEEFHPCPRLPGAEARQIVRGLFVTVAYNWRRWQEETPCPPGS